MSNRLNNTLRNTVFGLLLKIIMLLGAFITRTMIIYILGVEYIGLDGLFSSVLTMLNMAELGFGSAIVFKLYKPIAENDDKKVCSLLNYYRKIYKYIGIAVMILGIIIIPFLKYFIKGNTPNNINVIILYLIYLVNTCFSYWFFAYKTVLVNALNRNDIISKITSLTYIIKYITQLLLLLLFKNYYVYVIVIPLITLLTNIGNSIITKKKYPKYICCGEISIEDKKEIKKKVCALMYNKLGTTIITASDNIVISSFLGLSILGIYDSYYYVFTMLYYFFSVFHNSMQAGIGNSIIIENVKENYSLFSRLSFINAWLVGWCSICLLCLYDPFMSLWIGKEKVFGISFSLIMSIYFYFWLIRFITILFKSAQGLWWEDRFRAAIEGIFNLILNIILINYIGIYGVIISTIASMLIISIPWETKILFKKYFLMSPKKYYFQMLKWIAITIFSGIISYFICSIVRNINITTIIIRMFICIIIPNIIYWCFYRKSSEYIYTHKLIKKILWRKNEI